MFTGRSAPWSKWELDSATGLALLVTDILAETDSDEVRSNVLVRLNDQRLQVDPHSEREGGGEAERAATSSFASREREREREREQRD